MAYVPIYYELRTLLLGNSARLWLLVSRLRHQGVALRFLAFSVPEPPLPRWRVQALERSMRSGVVPA